ncbi:hypothetical protein C2S51_020924 [Perilla frutescens var. frutescens]|nr:hypothetical protein C2S51_020924 [Perilla frutescens var. frutescens]
MRLKELTANLQKQRQENDIKEKRPDIPEPGNELGKQKQGDDVAGSFNQKELDAIPKNFEVRPEKRPGLPEKCRSTGPSTICTEREREINMSKKELGEIASAYYGKASEEERKKVKEFVNGFDSMGDGRRSFEDIMPYYYIKVMHFRWCDACYASKPPYFFCVECLDSNTPRMICIDCFRGGKFQHPHSTSNFLEPLALLELFRKRDTDDYQTYKKIREITRAYYARASEEEKKLAKELFKTLDANGDAKVSLAEFKASAGSWFSNDLLFERLDENGDGSLDFDEALALHYMKKAKILKCNRCRRFLVDAYFSCLPCLEKAPHTFDLCCGCYGRGKFEHDHPPTDFLDHHSLLQLFRYRTADEQKNQGKRKMDCIKEIARGNYARASEEERKSAKELFKRLELVDGNGKVKFVEFKASVESWLRELLYQNGDVSALEFDEALALHFMAKKLTIIPNYTQVKQEMEEVMEIAKAHYRASSPEVQALAHELFDSLDTDGDGRIDLSEFLDFMRQEGHAQMRNRHFFKEVDINGNDSLDFLEFITLYYIIKSGRPICDHCGNFTPGMFFSCVDCFKSTSSNNTSFNLCRNCYSSSKWNHNHNGRTRFLDNYALLQAHQNIEPMIEGGSNGAAPYTPNEIVHDSNEKKWKVAMREFDAALTTGSGTCTIM